MACAPHAAQLEEGERVSASVSYSRSPEHTDSICWLQELYNGQILAVVHTQSDSSFTPGSLDVCMEKLKALGIQIPLEGYKSFIPNPILKPEVRRYMFFSSRAFGIVLAVVIYVSMWANIYCTLQMFSFGHHWSASIFVSLCATAATILIILIIDHHQRQLNVNTDVSVAAVNEILMKYNVLAGITDDMDGYQNVLQLWFVRFDLEKCLQSLSSRLAELKKNDQSVLRCLEHLCINIETASKPDTESGAERNSRMCAPSEAAPLLSSNRNSKRKAFRASEVVSLVPGSGPKVIAHQLLVLFSGCYIRLLVTGQLPHIAVARHAGKINTPCLCQFIESSALHSGRHWFKSSVHNT